MIPGSLRVGLLCRYKSSLVFPADRYVITLVIFPDRRGSSIQTTNMIFSKTVKGHPYFLITQPHSGGGTCHYSTKRAGGVNTILSPISNTIATAFMSEICNSVALQHQFLALYSSSSALPAAAVSRVCGRRRHSGLICCLIPACIDGFTGHHSSPCGPLSGTCSHGERITKHAARRLAPSQESLA